MSNNTNPVCDHCGRPLHRQRRGQWWVDSDDTSDCPINAGGHTVDGRFR